jgi:type II secretory pathway component HofQ
MENMLKGSVSVDMSQPPAVIYEDLALRAGMNVIIDRAVREIPASRFHVEGLDLINALDLLAIQTSTFWLPLNETTIHVMQDTQQNRRDQDRMQVKIINLPPMVSSTVLNETINLLRTSLSMRGIYQDDKHKAVVMRDTPLRVFLAEKTIADLTKKFGKTTSVTLSTGNGSLYAENGWVLSNAANARPQLEVKLRSRTTIRLNDTPMATFTELADLAGLKVSDNSLFRQEAELPFNLYNVDILDALDLFAWQTRHFWQVVDEHTIRVVPDTQQMRRDLEPRIDKTIVPADATGATGLLNVLRTTFGLREIFQNDKNAFVIRDTAENVAMAEKLVEILGTGEPTK